MESSIDINKKIILFDGVCNLCNSAVNYVIEHDAKDFFRFASLQSKAGIELMEERGIDPNAIDSIILIEPGIAYYNKSTAALKIAKHLSGSISLLRFFSVLPEGFRNLVYDFIAKNRYQWFGKKDACMIPTPELKAKFL
ncbi:Predicted thiol-disulfide oxidoreductase YuxK, DCC family [Gillisia sp. Hel1_33_143]|uniref:thiol-disulfide oxidoreductase DCC family protein n=1 Tax=Gillisia sp. Hel1_33_143 TaxID=1336796 RepID=UPI00087A9937|nr:thiol-disulfide oxidoreductase DCC family protein [Gillisia sp. Hel1_33_143]SDS57284.1 Predicted thiol-disulfide oxidoreductase YuxK, DCC family [Gillisia sp. Hel1_33_143]